MDVDRAKLLDSIAAAARELPRSVVEELCDTLEGLSEDATPGQRAALPGIVASPRARARVSALIETWSTARDVSSANLAWALRAASYADERRRKEQTIELVWTGPSPEGTVLRRTDQALLDLIRSARHTLHVVTFAAYKIPVLNEAMLAAARRGVEISLIFETADAGKVSFTATRAVGEELEALCSIYIWPPDERPRDSAGRYGSLHAKCAVADTDAV
nr:phospholipase [Rubrobacter sp.]